MRKILAIILVALMALSFIPFRNTKTVEAYDKTKATMVANAMMRVQPDLSTPNLYDYLVNNEPIYYDADDNGLVSAGDIHIVGPVASDGAILINDGSGELWLDWLCFVDSDGDDLWDVGESIYYDYSHIDWEVDASDILIYGPGAPVGTPLNGAALSPYGNDPRLRFVDVDYNGNWGPAVQRPFSFTWGRADYEFEYDPFLATDMYLTVVSEGGKSELKDHYYVVMTIEEFGAEEAIPFQIDKQGIITFYIDPDTTFNVPQCSDPASWNNTMGPFYLGDTVTLWTGPAAGRTFQIGTVDMTQSGIMDHEIINGPAYVDSGDLFLFYEVLRASCCGKQITYDISVESDVEPVAWPNPLTADPKAVAVLGPGTGTDFAPKTQELARSVVYKISTTTFFDITLTNREYLDLEIFRDDGFDNEDYDGFYGFDEGCIPDNTCDDYYINFGDEIISVKEEFVGALDFNYGEEVAGSYIIYGTDPISGTKVYALDMDADQIINVGDYLLKPINTEMFLITALVDADFQYLVNLTIKWNSNIFYLDIDDSGDLGVGDTLVFGDTWFIENPVYGITMYFGDFQGMDILVLPGTMAIDVTIETEAGVKVSELKVEQTYTVWVSLPEDCKLPPKTRVLVVLELPGYDIGGNPYYEIVATRILTPESPKAKIDNVTPWRGTLWKDDAHYIPKFRVSAFVDVCSAVGPKDGNYGRIYYGDPDCFWSWSIRIPALNGTNSYRGPALGNSPNCEGCDFGNTYDCFVIKTYNINPEDLTLTPNRDCISPLDQVFPNIGFQIYNVNNPEDVDDPYGVMKDDGNQDLFAYVNANGVGVQFLAIVVDEKQDIHIVQVNDGGTIYVWDWDDDGDLVYERGEVTDEPNLVNGRWYPQVDDLDEDGIPSPGDTLNGTDFVIVDYPLPSAIESNGVVYAVVKPPKSGCAEINFTVFTTAVIYNSIGPRPPSYLFDDIADINGDPPPPYETDFNLIDYMGEVKVIVEKLYDVNFSEFRAWDTSLWMSPFANPYPPYGPTSGGAWAAQYPWRLRNLMFELRSYPGGQTDLHGFGWAIDYEGLPNAGPTLAGDVVWPGNPLGLTYTAFNARHAQKRELFWKLGTEYYPLTDYTFKFLVKDEKGHIMSFYATDPSLRISTIEVIGEKASPDGQPVFWFRPPLESGDCWNYQYMGPVISPNKAKDSPSTDLKDSSATDGVYDYNGGWGLPVGYDTSGYLVFTSSFNYEGWAYLDEFDTWGWENVQKIPGIIPTGPGIIKIVVTDALGNKTSYKYCTSCYDSPEGIPVHAIELTGFPESVTVDKDTTLEIVAKTYPYDKTNAPWGENTQLGTQPLANNVVAFVWQDMGVEDPTTELRYGVGDGWITGQPYHKGGAPIDTLDGSVWRTTPVYNARDWNNDGKISFMDHETEIVGTYDLNHYVWKGGFKYLDSRTYQIQDGKYIFDLNSENGALITEIGFDFDQNNVLLSDEEIPIRITAYQYGDDGNNPRTYGAYGNGLEAWEVFLAGEVMVPVVGVNDWNVESEPCLTAGVLPEAQPDGKPLTFMVTDADGNPVDLSVGLGGGAVNDIMIWNGLFDDVVPSVLPSYYWVRTDLHNDDWIIDPDTGLTHYLNGRAANDMYVYDPYDWNGDGITLVDPVGNTLEPILPDFEEKADGVYKFNGFVANDKGEFEVRVYSPDRKHYATKKVVVELPKISYDIVNIEDPNGTVHTVPGDPDFVMTVGDLRIYKVTVTVLDCEDKPIGGPPEVGECEPEAGGLYAGFLPYMGYTPHYYNWVGDDFNWDGIVDFDEWAPFAARASGYDRISPSGESPKEKPAVKEIYGPKTWAQYLFYWGMSTKDGFMGQQGIFNSNYDIGPYPIGNMYPDVNQDGVVDVDDTWALDENGKATFYVEADDISALSGIVGKNPYVLIFDNDYGRYDLGDVAGWAKILDYPDAYPGYLSYPRYRFGAFWNGSGSGFDMGFFLDWYGNVDKKVDVNFMKFNILNGETHQELGKEIFNERYYDLTYGVENHIVVQALPADERDIAVRELTQVQLVGINVEPWAAGTLMHNADGVAETTLNFSPKGVGSRVAYLGVVTRWGADMMWQHNDLYPWYIDFTSVGEPLYWTYDDRAPDNTGGCFSSVTSIANIFYSFNDCFLDTPYGHDIEDQRKLTRLNPPVGSSSWPLPYFDSGKGLGLTLKGDLTVGVETEVTVKVTEAGPNFPVAGAEVTLYGAGVDSSLVTDADGVAKFLVKPTEAGEILITATKDGYVPGKTVVVVGADTIAPELSVDKPVSPTNKPTVTITGIATDNAGVPTVLVNSNKATVDADGKFSAEVTLIEGENDIVVVAIDKSGNKTEKLLKVVLDTIQPNVTVNALPSPLTSTKVKLTGYVEIGATVLVNDKPATVASDDWEVELTLDYGENLVTVVAKDSVGNEKKVETTVVIFKRTALELQIGSPTPKVNGVYGDPLEAAPFIKDGRTMVPLRFIAEAFGANVEWIPETKGINISLELASAVHTIGLQVGNPTAIVDGEVVTLDVAPVIVNGRTFVPIRFIAESFGATVDWNDLYQVVTIDFLWY